jgi:hypothetical protein
MSEGNYFGVESVAPDPHDANVVYAAVGMYRSGRAAILRSMNRGATWKIIPVPFRMGGNEDGRAAWVSVWPSTRKTPPLSISARDRTVYNAVPIEV